ncbi:unnamed protein product [Cylicocyclus nassatus]|uniref:Uncharacterized protein n=1 Tax=Cylicocyclus nassatus TaxID=53992 RepID=A0AA36HF03_CYLNA|nr:unnamed protein product [Cylicocyclus nassatus]
MRDLQRGRKRSRVSHSTPWTKDYFDVLSLQSWVVFSPVRQNGPKRSAVLDSYLTFILLRLEIEIWAGEVARTGF